MNWLRTFLRKLNRFNDRNYPKYSIDMWINNSNFMSVCCRLINTKIGSNGFICINICKIISFQRKIPKYLCILGRDVSNHVPIKVLWFIQFRFYLWPLCHGRTSISTCYPLTSTENYKLTFQSTFYLNLNSNSNMNTGSLAGG